MNWLTGCSCFAQLLQQTVGLLPHVSVSSSRRQLHFDSQPVSCGRRWYACNFSRWNRTKQRGGGTNMKKKFILCSFLFRCFSFNRIFVAFNEFFFLSGQSYCRRIKLCLLRERKGRQRGWIYTDTVILMDTDTVFLMDTFVYRI